MAIESMYVFTGDEVVATDLPAKLNENFAKTENNRLKTVNNVAQDENNNINVTELVPKQITSNTNLNNLVTSGEYTFTKGSANITNSPTTNSFFLTVLRNNALVKQVVTEVVLDDPITYTRVLSGSSWSPWVEGGKVKTINNIKPDDSGNIQIDNIAHANNAKSADSVEWNNVKNKPTNVSAFINDAGYLTQHQSLDGYAKTSVVNIWTDQQNFHDLMLYREKYTTYVVNGTSNTPTTSTMFYTATGAFTLDLRSISSKLATEEATVFTAYIKSNANYTLTLKNAGTIKYIGSASDVAITKAGLLLNIMMLKDKSGDLTSIVQASKLS